MKSQMEHTAMFNFSNCFKPSLSLQFNITDFGFLKLANDSDGSIPSYIDYSSCWQLNTNNNRDYISRITPRLFIEYIDSISRLCLFLFLLILHFLSSRICNVFPCRHYPVVFVVAVVSLHSVTSSAFLAVHFTHIITPRTGGWKLIWFV